jgi:hypothetical protein
MLSAGLYRRCCRCAQHKNHDAPTKYCPTHGTFPASSGGKGNVFEHALPRALECRAANERPAPGSRWRVRLVHLSQPASTRY